jgi:hypothetical protein
MNLRVACVERVKRCQRPLPTILEVLPTAVRPPKKKRRSTVNVKMTIVVILTIAMVVLSGISVIRAMRAMTREMYASLAGASQYYYIGPASTRTAKALALGK